MVIGVKNFLLVLPRAAAVSVLVVGLGGCNLTQDLGDSTLVTPVTGQLLAEINAATTLSSAINNDATYKSLIERMRNGEDALWETLLGENFLYVPDDYRELYTSSPEYFFGVLLGSHLASQPVITDQLINAALTQCGPLCRQYGLQKKAIDNDYLNYLRGFGSIWKKSLRDSNEAKIIEERYKLFQARLGNYGPVRMDAVRDLLRDDDALKSFLGIGPGKDEYGRPDSSFAKNWILNNSKRDYREIQSWLIMASFPDVTVSQLPGLAS